MSGASKTSSKQFQAPKGTRDFYPADLAVRRHIENIWRQTSINHGFDEIDGPTFEHLDLYTHKSGPGIASELFQVFSGKDPEQAAAIRAGGTAPLALRPEFTPTLARMVAARAPELPRPIKWFAIPSHFRAESPQRGRLREFMQWNMDFIGDESPLSDIEILKCCINALETLGLSAGDARVLYADRQIVRVMLERVGIPADQSESWLLWIDKHDRLARDERLAAAAEFGGSAEHVNTVEHLVRGFEPGVSNAARDKMLSQGKSERVQEIADYAEATVREELRPSQRRMAEFVRLLDAHGLSEWCTFQPKIVRGLAYYTGLVFEIHEMSGAERAIAGGGRYDKLIEGFGGPPLPACGFGMGDVVLANILKDKDLLKPAEEYLPRPDAFVIAASDEAAARVPALVADLRRGGLHVRQSYKTTRNVGKLLGDAGKCRARYAVILGAELAESPPRVALKNMDSGAQDTLALDELAAKLRAAAHAPPLP